MGSSSSKKNTNNQRDAQQYEGAQEGSSKIESADLNDAEKQIRRIHVACRKENIEALSSLINDYKVSVSEPDLETGKTCLHFCASNKKTDCAEMILDTDGTVLNSKDDAGFTAFLTATVAGNSDMVKFLKRKGANIKTTDHEGHSATHWAAVCGQSEILDYLNDCGLELSACDKNGATPLHYAVHASDDVPKEQSQKIVKMLLSKKVKVDAVDEDKRTPLIWAASSGRDKICEYLLDDGADIEAKDQDGLTSLHSAAAKGHDKTVDVLLRRGALTESTDKNECTALFYAIHQKEMECTRLLLENKANPEHCDKKGRSVPHCAASIGQLEGMKLLKKHRANLWISSKNTEDLPIHEAAVNGHTDVVKYLLDNSNDPNNINKGNANQKNCLHLAALSNNLPLTKYMVEKGADVNATMKHSSGKMYPYDCAVMQNNTEVADYLRKNKGISIKDEKEKPYQTAPVAQKVSETSRSKKADQKEFGVQTIENKNAAANQINSESQTSFNNEKSLNNNYYNSKRELSSEVGVQTTARRRRSSSFDEDQSPGKSHRSRRSPKKSPNKSPKRSSGRDSETDMNSDSGNGESDDERKKKIKNYRRGDPNYVSPYKYYPQKDRNNADNRKVRAYETKRLAAMKMNHANRMQMNGKGFSEERLVRKLARDYNDDARNEDRIPSGHFKSMKEFHNFLKGEIDIADVDEKRLKKLEKVKPIYYITF